MSSLVAEAVAATHKDVPRLTTLFQRGFSDEPVERWMFPGVRYRRVMSHLRFASLIIDGLRHGTVLMLRDRSAAAIWFPPKQRESSRNIPGLLYRFLLSMRPQSGEAERHCYTELERRRPRTPHWYLAAVTTEEDLRGQGRARRVLRPILNLCDERLITAYLETSEPKSLPFYERQGFDVENMFYVAPDLAVWCMSRRPKNTARV